MLAYSRCLYMALIGTSTLVICLTSLFYLSFTDNHLSHLSLRSQFSLNQFPLAAKPHASYHRLLADIRPSDAQSRSRILGIASHIYVLSLPRRVDRRRSMESLSRALNLQFEYVDGLEATDVSVDYALDTLKRERKAFRKKYTQNHGGVVFPGFAFPGLDADAWFNGTYSLATSSSSSSATHTSGPTGPNDTPIHGKDLPPVCATPEDPFPDLLSEIELSMLPPWRILSREMIACWIAHLGIIHKIANLQDETAVVIVLEDDVDMEFDIERRLQRIWPALPHKGWDIVMLGYCHSDEMSHPPLDGAPSVRPSFAPKCTHAYALSRDGARRLFQILSKTGFAYSRALDQALSWLIRTKELRSYSIVPAIVVQSKRTRSDIWPHHSTTPELSELGSGSQKGSKWRDALVDSILERIEMVASVAADVPRVYHDSER